jgi:hypothetical protein
MIAQAARGWAGRAPVSAAAIAAHLAGGLGLLITNRGRVAGQSGGTANTVIKTSITVAALGTAAYSGLLGARIAQAGRVPAEGATEWAQNTGRRRRDAEAATRPAEVIPALTGTMIAMGAQQGEQQRPRQVWGGVAGKLSGLIGRCGRPQGRSRVCLLRPAHPSRQSAAGARVTRGALAAPNASEPTGAGTPGWGVPTTARASTQ